MRGDLAASPGEPLVAGVPLERVDDFKYLGSYIGSVDHDIRERCSAASRACGRLMAVWNAPLQVDMKLSPWWFSGMGSAVRRGAEIVRVPTWKGNVCT